MGVAVEFEVPVLERDVPERKTCEDFDDVDEVLELPTTSPVVKANIVVEPIVLVIVVESLVTVERIGDVVIGEDEVCTVIVDLYEI